MKKKKLGKALLIVLIISVILIPVTGYKVKGNNTVKYTKVIVYPGDTLWSIASNHNESNSDIRKIIHKIRTANNLDTAVIMPGQELVIPLQ
jgi:LysM repeat protein